MISRYRRNYTRLTSIEGLRSLTWQDDEGERSTRKEDVPFPDFPTYQACGSLDSPWSHILAGERRSFRHLHFQ